MNCTNCMNCDESCQQKASDSPSLFCMNCDVKTAPCLLNCPNNAIEVLGGAITRNENKCIRCGRCEKTCPIGAIKIQ